MDPLGHSRSSRADGLGLAAVGRGFSAFRADQDQACDLIDRIRAAITD